MKEPSNSAAGPQAPTPQAPAPRTSPYRAPTPRTPGTRAAGPAGPAPRRPVPAPRTTTLGGAAAPPSVVVIVPTRDEAENVGELLGRLDRAIPQELAAEVLFVDDSRDSTPDVIRAVDGPLADVHDESLRGLEYPPPAQSLPLVWMAVRGSLRRVLETVSVADLVAGELPEGVVALADEYRRSTEERFGR